MGEQKKKLPLQNAAVDSFFVSIRVSRIKVRAQSPHFTITYKRFSVHFTHSYLNFRCIASFSIQKWSAECNSHFAGDSICTNILKCSNVLRNDNWESTLFSEKLEPQGETSAHTSSGFARKLFLATNQTLKKYSPRALNFLNILNSLKDFRN